VALDYSSTASMIFNTARSVGEARVWAMESCTTADYAENQHTYFFDDGSQLKFTNTGMEYQAK
jgi:hypothetical protein